MKASRSFLAGGVLAFVIGAHLGAWGHAAGAESPPAGGATGVVVVLDTAGAWRLYDNLTPPVVQLGGALKTVDNLAAKENPPLPADWTKPDFDDGLWLRGPARSGCRTPYVAHLYLRGRFTVTDPAKVTGLALSLGYYGGAVVYLNGTEVARGNLAAGSVAADAVAEAYPTEVFVGEDGKVLGIRGDEGLWKGATPEQLRRLGLRTRTLSAEIPKGLLRPGVNVLAVGIVRAPYDKAIDEQKVMPKAREKTPAENLSWNTCEVRRVQVTAAGGDGIVPSATRPKGLQVWNSDVMATDYDLDFGNPSEPLRPIAIAGPRNGSFSGKVGVGCDKPIAELKATVSDLKGPSGAIPAAQVRIRYGMPWGAVSMTNLDSDEVTPYPASTAPLLALDDTPPAEIPVRKNPITPTSLKLPGQLEPSFGAVTSVWVTVRIPKDAKPGRYEGQLTIQARGEKTVTVAVHLDVGPWQLPDPQDYRTWVDLMQSPDTLAVEYNVPLWSDEHFALIARSFDLIGETGSRIVYAPLIAHTNLGNSETMVRWIKKGEGQYDFDFSIMDKYLDTASKHLGKPRIVVLNAWDLYMTKKPSPYAGEMLREIAGRKGKVGLGPLVTVLDPTTKKTEQVYLPDYDDAASKAPWKALYAQLREHMKARGIEGAMMLGMSSDAWPSKEQVEFLKEASGGLPWVHQSHGGLTGALQGVGEVGYQATVFGAAFGFGGSLQGWKQPGLVALFDRSQWFPGHPLARWRHMGELAITGDKRGVGRLGADFWPVLKDMSGQRRGVIWQQYPEASWRVLSIAYCTLAPGHKSPVATSRFEMFREGIQECEARIALEQALGDKTLRARLGEPMALACQQALDEHRQAMFRSHSEMQFGPATPQLAEMWRWMGGYNGTQWFIQSGWQERTAKLYDLAAEVEKKLGAM